MSRPTQMLSIRLKEKWHAIIATAGAASRNTTGRSGPVVSEPATCLAGVACYQHKRVVVALHVPGDDVVGDLLRGARKRQRFRESVLDAVGKQNDGIAEIGRASCRERGGGERVEVA